MTATLPVRQWPIPSKPSKAGQQHGGAERDVHDASSLALLADDTWHDSKAGTLELPPVQARPAIRARRTLDYGGPAVVECDKRHTHPMEQGIGPVRRNLFRQDARKHAVVRSLRRVHFSQRRCCAIMKKVPKWKANMCLVIWRTGRAPSDCPHRSLGRTACAGRGN